MRYASLKANGYGRAANKVLVSQRMKRACMRCGPPTPSARSNHVTTYRRPRRARRLSRSSDRARRTSISLNEISSRCGTGVLVRSHDLRAAESAREGQRKFSATEKSGSAIRNERETNLRRRRSRFAIFWSPQARFPAAAGAFGGDGVRRPVVPRARATGRAAVERRQPRSPSTAGSQAADRDGETGSQASTDVETSARPASLPLQGCRRAVSVSAPSGGDR